MLARCFKLLNRDMSIQNADSRKKQMQVENVCITPGNLHTNEKAYPWYRPTEITSK
jgi:hypothetical protein